MGNPDLLQELPHIPALLPERCRGREQAAAANGTAGGLDAMSDGGGRWSRVCAGGVSAEPT